MSKDRSTMKSNSSMLSSNTSSFLAASDGIPTWDVINEALRPVLAKYDLEFNLTHTQRLSSKDAEKILYHLIRTIDPNECRRRFWSIYPSRDHEEGKLFKERTVEFINRKQLCPFRISTGHLNMCGGAPFRQILARLVKKATEIEEELLERQRYFETLIPYLGIEPIDLAQKPAI